MESLDRPFKVIAFDWDGTAVMSRIEDATAVRRRLEQLLGFDVYVVIITGTNFPNINRQVASDIFGTHKRYLFVCTNRGSEVYGFDNDSQPKLIWQRMATQEENRKLDEVAARMRHWIESRSGLTVKIIADRMNRRKIDLIPVAKWADPPKSAIGELAQAVERRLTGAGISGAVAEVIAVTEHVAREVGLENVRITSDVKHVEVGLTDKGDSVDWMIDDIVVKNGLIPQEVLIAGDEFGPIDGFPGSDFKMVRPSAIGAVYVSVGKEPKGVPAEIIHVGGGPAGFLALLDEQIARHDRRGRSFARALSVAPEGTVAPTTAVPMEAVLEERTTADWELVEVGYNPSREHEIESIFAIGNGYLGARGSLSECVTISRPATFIAGLFELPQRPSAVPELVKAPDWSRLLVNVEGETLHLEAGEVLEHRRILDLQNGLLRREWRYKDAVGRVTRLAYSRLASLADRHALVETVSITPENYGGRIIVESAIDGAVTGATGLEYPLPRDPDEPVLVLRSLASGAEIAFALATNLLPRSGHQHEPTLIRSHSTLTQRWEWPAEMGREYRVDKLVAVYTSRETKEPARAAMQHIEKISEQGTAALQDAHERAWALRWQGADVQIEGDVEAQRAVRFANYHLISAANEDDDRVSIGARGLTGEAYKGHVFWDTETFMLPFFTFTQPAIARTLLHYRYNTLPAARERARRMGYRGALYAWESTDTGEDVTPTLVFTPDGQMIKILCGEMEHHISADVAYAVWQYWTVTHDEGFLRECGADIMFETARFWASRGQVEADDLYHIRRVIGPDEYHEGVDDNAYTNIMAQWVLERAVSLATMLRERWPDVSSRLAERLSLSPSEVGRWRDLAEHTYTGFDLKTGVYEQFAGYFDLEDIDLRALEPRTAPIDVILGRQRTQASKVIKQADVVMLVHLLWNRFSPEVREANFRYYEPRCDHGSSLSPAVHALVAARLGDLGTAERYFKQSAAIDLGNNMGNAASGVHMAAQGALWQSIVLGFAGMELRDDGVRFDPHLPPSWRRLSFPVQWRDRRLRFEGRQRPYGVEVTLERGEPMMVLLGSGQPATIEAGKPLAIGQYRSVRRDEEVA